MAAVPPRPERRRPRPGSLERPVSGRLYRGTWLLVGLPLLIAAFSVAKPYVLPPPQLPPVFDTRGAAELANELSVNYPNRFPNSVGALQAAVWFRDQLSPYGLDTRVEPFTASVPGGGRLRLQNIVTRVAGRSPATIVVMAHRDDNGTGPGANDNASGTAALIQLARAYSIPRTTPALHLTPVHTLLFLSTDGGSLGGLGAAEFLAHAPERNDVVAVVNLDAIAGAARPRLEAGGDTPRTTSATLLKTTASRIAKEYGRGPSRPSVLRQLIDLGFPFSLYEQAPFISRGIPAVTITTAGDLPPDPSQDRPGRVDATRLGQLGRAAQDLLQTLDQGLEFAQSTSSYVYVGSRVIRGWAIELVLIAMLVPFFAAAVDVFARCRRRRIRLAPALRSYRSRLAFWLWVTVSFEFLALVGLWPGGTGRPPLPTSHVARHWPTAGGLLLTGFALAGWLVTRDRLLPRRPITAEEELAGHTAALLCLGAVALLVVATNPFALLFVLPSLHGWLWLPNIRHRSPWLRAAVVIAGFAGPGLIVGSFAFRYGLGWHAPWYIAELHVLGYVPFVVVPIAAAWMAGAAQLVTLTAGRYAPYPEPAERPRLGPARRVLRRIVLSTRAQRASRLERRALEG
jgi:Peptidase family M28